MKKVVLVLLLFVFVSLFFFLKERAPTNDVDDINPFLLLNEENLVFDREMLGTLSIVWSYRMNWLYNTSTPMLYYMTDFSNNIYKYVPRTNFRVVSVDSLFSGTVDTVSKAMFELERGKIVNAFVEMKNERKKWCSFQYEGTFCRSICRDNYTVILEKGNLVYSDSVENMKTIWNDRWEEIESYYSKNQKNLLRKRVYEFNKKDSLSQLVVKQHDSSLVNYLFKRDENGKLKTLYSNKGSSLTIHYDSTSVDSIKTFVENDFPDGQKKTFCIISTRDSELISGHEDSSLAKVERVEQDGFDVTLFLTASLDTLEKISMKDGAVYEITISLRSEVVEGDYDGFRKIRFFKDDSESVAK